MAPTKSELAVNPVTESPSLLDEAQTLKAASFLLQHIKKKAGEKAATTDKKNLLEDADDTQNVYVESTPIWLNITTKTHVVDAKRLKPSKLALPHPFTHPAGTTVCLITADPQRTYKDIVVNEEVPFPALQGGNVTIARVIGVTKLKAKYKKYEEQRQLRDQYDIFLADDRIITRLPDILGKSFYKSTQKRPIPVSLAAEKPRDATGKRIASTQNQSAASKPNTLLSKARDAKTMHAEIERTLNSALLALSPSTQTSVRIGYASWSAENIAANIVSVANQTIEKFVPKKWANVRAIHIKGPETSAMPIWQTTELWVDETKVLEDAPEEMKSVENGELSGGKKSKSKKRKCGLGDDVEPDAKKQKALPDGDDGKLDQEIAMRKEKLRKQKEEAVKEDVAVIEVKASTVVKAMKGGKKVKKVKSVDVVMADA